MVLKAALKNERRPEYGAVTIPFPIPKEEYDSTIRMLEALDIGDAVRRDCTVEEVQSGCSILQRLEGKQVNLDELDYLAKRLDSFDTGEAAQFQGMACKLNLTDMKDLINLTFSCQQATVITDFSDLEEIGRSHYLNTHGGCASMEELEQLDGTETAILLMTDNEGTVTPYGVVYDNGMQMEQLYKEKEFPAYLYEPCLMTVTMTPVHQTDGPENTTWLFLPAADQQIQRAMVRAGINSEDDARFYIDENRLPKDAQWDSVIEREDIFALNRLCWAITSMEPNELAKLRAAVSLAEPETADETIRLAKNLDHFDFAPGVQTPAEYGKYMIQQSGHFDYDPNLDEFYDYERYGRQRMKQESGVFTEQGYISYHGTISLEELMSDDPAEQYQREQEAGMGMGGLT